VFAAETGVCSTCGEEYLSSPVMKELEVAVEQAQGAGLDVGCGTTRPPDPASPSR